jgi:hypothetical protein
MSEKIFDEFIGELIKKDNSLIMTIPNKNVVFSGLKKGDLLKIRYIKQDAI